MVTVTINGISVTVPENTTIMEAAASAGIQIPSLCYLKDINEIGACRVCCVEVQGEKRMVPACNNLVRAGMVVETNSPRARMTRRTNVEFILSQHDCHCATCVRSGNCRLQRLANDLGILTNPYAEDLPRGVHGKWTTTFPLYRDAKKCIKCLRCVQICDKVQSLNIWEMTGSGGRATVDVSRNRKIKESECSLCGQCITHCPVGALRERDDTAQAFAALARTEEIVPVIQIAPAVRAAWGEAFDNKAIGMGQIVTALHRMGFRYVFDTTFSADLTIMEESAEFLTRFKTGELKNMPMFTSCCPGWVRFLKSQFPQDVPYLSTAKSPQQMFGAIAKSYLASQLDIDPRRIYSISVMPCIAKKSECDLPTMQSAEYGKDVDLVLTTRELVRMLRAEQIIVEDLPAEAPDYPLGVGTGAGVIFGATGGVMEAALRTAHYCLTGQNPAPDAFGEVRGQNGWREAVFDMAGTPIRCAVASGLGNARKLLEALHENSVHYDFVEIMACPGGCVGGGGQPVSMQDCERAEQRSHRLYHLDAHAVLRFSHENPEIKALYAQYLDAPLSERAEQLLHTCHTAWNMPCKI